MDGRKNKYNHNCIFRFSVFIPATAGPPLIHLLTDWPVQLMYSGSGQSGAGTQIRPTPSSAYSSRPDGVAEWAEPWSDWDLSCGHNSQSWGDIPLSPAQLGCHLPTSQTARTNGGVAGGQGRARARPSLKVNQRLQSLLQPPNNNKNPGPKSRKPVRSLPPPVAGPPHE